MYGLHTRELSYSALFLVRESDNYSQKFSTSGIGWFGRRAVVDQGDSSTPWVDIVLFAGEILPNYCSTSIFILFPRNGFNFAVKQWSDKFVAAFLCL